MSRLSGHLGILVDFDVRKQKRCHFLVHDINKCMINEFSVVQSDAPVYI